MHVVAGNIHQQDNKENIMATLKLNGSRMIKHTPGGEPNKADCDSEYSCIVKSDTDGVITENSYKVILTNQWYEDYTAAYPHVKAKLIAVNIVKEGEINEPEAITGSQPETIKKKDKPIVPDLDMYETGEDEDSGE